MYIKCQLLEYLFWSAFHLYNYFNDFSGFLLGVFDGHGGSACAQVVSKRLLQYIAASLLPEDLLKKYMEDASRETLMETFNDKVSSMMSSSSFQQ